MDNIDDYTVQLVLDNDSRVFELRAIGPASLLKYFLLDSKWSVIDKLEEEIKFDELIPQLNGLENF